MYEDTARLKSEGKIYFFVTLKITVSEKKKNKMLKYFNRKKWLPTVFTKNSKGIFLFKNKKYGIFRIQTLLILWISENKEEHFKTIQKRT